MNMLVLWVPGLSKELKGAPSTRRCSRRRATGHRTMQEPAFPRSGDLLAEGGQCAQSGERGGLGNTEI